MPLNGKQVVELSHVKAKIEAEKIRVDNATNRIKMLRDDFKDLVWKRFSLPYTPESHRVMKPFTNATINLFADVIEEISETYLEEPDRQFKISGKKKNENEGTNKKIEELVEIYKMAEVNKAMERVNEYMNAVNDVIIMPVWKNENIELRVYTPNKVKVIEDRENPTQPLAVMIESEDDDGKLEWIVWTDSEHYKMDADLRQQPIEGNENMVNPYGKIPMVYVHGKDIDGGFWDETSGEDLYESTLIINVKQSLKDYYFFWNSHKQLAVATDQNLPPGLSLSTHQILKVPVNSTITMMDFQIRFDALDSDIDRYALRIKQRYGVDISQFKGLKGGDEPSGRALKIKNSKLERIRKKQVKVLRDSEQKLFEIIKLVWGTHNKNPEYFKGIEMFIDYVASDQNIDEKEKVEILSMKVENNFMSIVDAFQALNKDYKDDKEAKEKVTEIIKTNNELRGLVDEPINEMINKDNE